MKSILVPIDFSGITAQVVALAKKVAKTFGANVHLVHVKELSSASPPGTMGYGVMGMPELMPTSGLPVPALEPTLEAIAPDEGQNWKLDEWQTEFTQAGVNATLHESIGPVVDEILKTAEIVQADLIVMGRHGHGAMYNLLVGSVTEGVLKRSSRPVLLVPGSREHRPRD